MGKTKLLKRILSVAIAAVSVSAIFLAACKSKKRGSPSNYNLVPTKLVTPIDLSINLSTKTLTWTGDANAVGYKVYERITTATEYSEHFTGISCKYDLSGLVEGAYELCVQAIGNGSDYSNSETSLTISYEVGAAGDVLPSEYAEAQAAKFEDKYSNLVDDVLGDLRAGVPVAEHRNNIAKATTYKAVDAAYKAGVEACDAKLLENAKSAANTAIDGYKNAENYKTNKIAYDEAISQAKTAIGVATDIEEAKTALVSGKTAIDAIEDDIQAAIPTIIIQVIAMLNGAEELGIVGELKVKSGVAVSVDDIESACNFSVYTLEGFYEDEACTEMQIVGSFSKTISGNTTIQIYAKVV